MSKTIFKTTYFHLLVALILGLGIFVLVPQTGGLTAEGVRFIAIVAPTIYLWLFVNTHWVSLLFLSLLAITGILAPNQVWAGSLGHFAVILVLSFTLIGECLNDHNVVSKLANWFISRKFVQGKPYAFMALFFASKFFIGIFMQTVAMAIIYIALVAQICKNLDVKKEDSLYRALMLGTIWANAVVSISSPIAKMLPNVVMGLIYNHFGVEITFTQWFMVGIPFSLVMFVLIIGTIRLINPDVTPLKSLKVEALAKDDSSLSIQGKIASLVMFLLILVLVIPEIFLMIGIFTEISSYIVGLAPTIPAIVAIIILSVIRVKGEPIMDFTKTLQKVPVHLLLFVSAVVIMGVPMASEATGFIPWVQNLFYPLVSGLTPMVLFIILVVVALVLTNFMSNTVVVTLFIALGATLLSGYLYLAVAFSVLVTYAASMACLTPPASVMAPLWYGPEHLKVKEAFWPNVIFMIISAIVVVAMIPVVIAVVG